MHPLLKSNDRQEHHSDLLWISKEQQKHPSTYAHPLKNSFQVDSQGIQYKFDGKHWRTLCQPTDGEECRNVVFRSSMCQKHFYKTNLFKRPYNKSRTKSSISSDVETTASDVIVSSPSNFDFFSIDFQEKTEHFDSNESLNSSLTMRFSQPPLTRTEEKSLANELIKQFSTDVSMIYAEQWTRQRVCQIIHDNYSQTVSSQQINAEWFYDFLLRNPRVPIHFQSWFSSVQPQLPSSDQLIDIKIWQLGLVTRSIKFIL